MRWIAECIRHARRNDVVEVESTDAADASWLEQVTESTNMTVVPQGEKANSWLAGANIEGKRRGANAYFGGADRYFRICEEVARAGYDGFELR